MSRVDDYVEGFDEDNSCTSVDSSEVTYKPKTKSHIEEFAAENDCTRVDWFEVGPFVDIPTKLKSDDCECLQKRYGDDYTVFFCRCSQGVIVVVFCNFFDRIDYDQLYTNFSGFFALPERCI